MAGFEPNRRLPSLRRALIRVHRDLLKIHPRMDLFAYYPEELSLFERMVLTLEDRRFFHHSGVDIVAILRVLWRATTFRRASGASTIDMQLVRVATGRYERKIKRKVYEMLLAQLLQYRYSKLVILRSYLQIAYFGFRMTGADTAAFQLFGTSTEHLDEEQSALLASQLVFPHPRNPSADWARKRLRRANYIRSVYVRTKKKADQL